MWKDQLGRVDFERFNEGVPSNKNVRRPLHDFLGPLLVSPEHTMEEILHRAYAFIGRTNPYRYDIRDGKDPDELLENWGRPIGRDGKYRGSRTAAIVVYYWLHHTHKEIANRIDQAIFSEPLQIVQVEAGEPTERVVASTKPDISPQPQLWLPSKQTVRSDRANWLSPHTLDALPFVGREQEVATLLAFMGGSSPFSVWGVSGPSGIGKTGVPASPVSPWRLTICST